MKHLALEVSKAERCRVRRRSAERLGTLQIRSASKATITEGVAPKEGALTS